MLKKTITYTDFDGIQRTEDFYFNLTKAEIAEMQLRSNNSLGEQLEAIGRSGNPSLIMDAFKDLIFQAYGERTPDGRGFKKSREIAEAFSHTEAYSVFFMELCTDSDAASAFVNGIIPRDLDTPISQPKSERPNTEMQAQQEQREHKLQELRTTEEKASLADNIGSNTVIATAQPFQTEEDFRAFRKWQQDQAHNG